MPATKILIKLFSLFMNALILNQPCASNTNQPRGFSKNTAVADVAAVVFAAAAAAAATASVFDAVVVGDVVAIAADAFGVAVWAVDKDDFFVASANAVAIDVASLLLLLQANSVAAVVVALYKL